MQGSGELLRATSEEFVIEISKYYTHHPLKKIILGDLWLSKSSCHSVGPAIQWGCNHENVALETYQQRTATEVDVCGLYLSTKFPFLGATPDGHVLINFLRSIVPINTEIHDS